MVGQSSQKTSGSGVGTASYKQYCSLVVPSFKLLVLTMLDTQLYLLDCIWRHLPRPYLLHNLLIIRTPEDKNGKEVLSVEDAKK